MVGSGRGLRRVEGDVVSSFKPGWLKGHKLRTIRDTGSDGEL